MTREIKFRAWHDGNKVMVNFDMSVVMRDMYQAMQLAELMHNKSEYLMQYTGLSDKNGVEIYDGDIITHDDFKINGEITFSIGCFRAFDFTLANFEAIHPISRIEVIGNIYENNELLEVEL